MLLLLFEYKNTTKAFDMQKKKKLVFLNYWTLFETKYVSLYYFILFYFLFIYVFVVCLFFS